MLSWFDRKTIWLKNNLTIVWSEVKKAINDANKTLSVYQEHAMFAMFIELSLKSAYHKNQYVHYVAQFYSCNLFILLSFTYSHIDFIKVYFPWCVIINALLKCRRKVFQREPAIFRKLWRRYDVFIICNFF